MASRNSWGCCSLRCCQPRLSLNEPCHGLYCSYDYDIREMVINIHGENLVEDDLNFDDEGGILKFIVRKRCRSTSEKDFIWTFAVNRNVLSRARLTRLLNSAFSHYRHLVLPDVFLTDRIAKVSPTGTLSLKYNHSSISRRTLVACTY
jgi:hypothetical protein